MKMMTEILQVMKRMNSDNHVDTEMSTPNYLWHPDTRTRKKEMTVKKARLCPKKIY